MVDVIFCGLDGFACENIPDLLGIDLSAVSVKATTEEHLGFTGRGEGISAQAVVLLRGK